MRNLLFLEVGPSGSSRKWTNEIGYDPKKQKFPQMLKNRGKFIEAMSYFLQNPSC